MKKILFLTILVLTLGAGCSSVQQSDNSEYREINNKQVVDEPDSENIIIPADDSLKKSFETAVQHSSMADVAELSCFPESRYDCSVQGCQAVKPETYFFVDYGTEQGTYFRCDEAGCDSYPVSIKQSGIFRQFIPTQGQSMLFKVSELTLPGYKGEFIDIATLGTSSVISFGKCI